MNEKRKLIDKITTLVIKYGDRFDKKHGNWIKLKYSNDLFISLDTRNGQLNIIQGIGEYKYWTDIEGKKLIHIGSSQCYYEQDYKYDTGLYQFWLDNVILAIKYYKGVENPIC